MSTLGNDIDVMFGDLDGNKQYTLSYHITQSNNTFLPSFKFVYADGTKSFMNNSGNTELDFEFSSTEGKKIEKIVLNWNTQSAGGIVEFSNIMLREANTDDTFVEHEEQTVTFPLEEGQVLHEGDYLADDGIHQVKREIVLNGMEAIGSYGTNEVVDGFYATFDNTNNKVLSYQSDDKCSHFKNLGHSPSWGKIANTFALSANGYIYVFFEKNVMANAAAVKTWLAEQYNAGTPLIVEGTLEDEIVTAYTEEQQEAYDKINELHSYQEVTHITCEDEIKTTQEVIYRKDFTLAQNNLQSQIDEIKASLTSEVSE